MWFSPLPSSLFWASFILWFMCNFIIVLSYIPCSYSLVKFFSSWMMVDMKCYVIDYKWNFLFKLMASTQPTLICSFSSTVRWSLSFFFCIALTASWHSVMCKHRLCVEVRRHRRELLLSCVSFPARDSHNRFSSHALLYMSHFTASRHHEWSHLVWTWSLHVLLVTITHACIWNWLQWWQKTMKYEKFLNEFLNDVKLILQLRTPLNSLMSI